MNTICCYVHEETEFSEAEWFIQGRTDWKRPHNFFCLMICPILPVHMCFLCSRMSKPLTSERFLKCYRNKTSKAERPGELPWWSSG